MLRIALSLLALTACSAFSQVKVSMKLDRPDYLVGEPIFVIVEVTNIGSEPIGYSGGDGRTDVTVAAAQPKQPPNLHGCYSGVGFGSGLGFVSHPPLMAPGQTISFRNLFNGYRLRSGAYTLSPLARAARISFNYSIGAPTCICAL